MYVNIVHLKHFCFLGKFSSTEVNFIPLHVCSFCGSQTYLFSGESGTLQERPYFCCAENDCWKHVHSMLTLDIQYNALGESADYTKLYEWKVSVHQRYSSQLLEPVRPKVYQIEGWRMLTELKKSIISKSLSCTVSEWTRCWNLGKALLVIYICAC